MTSPKYSVTNPNAAAKFTVSAYHRSVKKAPVSVSRRILTANSMPPEYCRCHGKICEWMIPGTGRVKPQCEWHGDELEQVVRYVGRCDACIREGAPSRDSQE